MVTYQPAEPLLRSYVRTSVYYFSCFLILVDSANHDNLLPLDLR